MVTHRPDRRAADMHLKETDALLFIGDSITDAGRDRTDSASLGSGYVREIARTLRARTSTGSGPAVVNKGLAGNRVYDLESRWMSDVIDQRPTVVTVLIGINDTWRRYDGGLISPVDEFEACLDRLLAQTARTLSARLFVITPFLLPVTPDQGGWYEDLSPRTDAVLRAAQGNGAHVVRADLALRRAAEEREAAELAPDGVHPSPLGHRLIADAWLAAVDAVTPNPPR
ncbi:SGNH/GDSL hydrolase family protein [Streptomyces sp. NBC_01242]|uniref:SGNH/GDSL hydrolase family protein n=1 Tax=unclassified Streptomyces TaxID=2593676 RepID=UPI0022506271|nr:SGNH/GDSL hydrolase family protein [Streptomyces sp. NBC_01242]MCX4793087.1 SGNH/GDSL hydrolase family protein [Streptomyces sp. NBC_01242]WSP59431.1 SGNH/GDSL hydrolase family protein [Streptomyces sp. NBC_01241]WSU20049.1 SGNH/GDSL hydrolase family protein [Streptomyces sp. NBC_01108]